MEAIKRICSQWLLDNFGLNAEVTKVNILGQTGPLDIQLGLGQVGFEFYTADGKIGDTVASLGVEVIEKAVLGVACERPLLMVQV